MDILCMAPGQSGPSRYPNPAAQHKHLFSGKGKFDSKPPGKPRKCTVQIEEKVNKRLDFPVAVHDVCYGRDLII